MIGFFLACTTTGAVIGPVEECTDSGCDEIVDATGEHVIELHINEIMADNGASYVTDEGTAPDWFELYNASALDLELEGFLVRDDLGSDEPYVFGAGLVVPGEGHLLLIADGEGKADNALPFKLSAGGEELGIYTPDDQAIDMVTFGQQVQDLSLARTEDGGDEWEYIAGGTPGEPND